MSGVEEFAGLPPTGNIPYGDGRGAVQYPESQMCLYDSIQQETTIVTSPHEPFGRPQGRRNWSCALR